MARQKPFNTEADLATLVSDWIQAQGWTAHHEVTWSGGASRADIVGALGPRLWVIECKMSLGLSVLAQAQAWRRYGHMVSVAVPTAKSSKARTFALTVADRFGIGVLAAEPGVAGYFGPQVKTLVHPAMNRRPLFSGELRKLLHQDQLTTLPGQQGGDYSTPFRRTCRALQDIIRGAGGKVLVREAMQSLVHHYASDRSARSSLVTLADRGVIKDVTMEREGRKVWFVSKSST